ncbi:MAG: YdeI/OmpD-associated family protein [Actinomycetes bacterium]
MTEAVDFEAALRGPSEAGNRTYLTLPFDPKALFGRARCPVRITINGHSWRTTTQVYGGEYRVVVSAAVRAAAGLEVGQSVHVHVKKDDSVPAVDLPLELSAALRADLDARDAFELLAPSHRREYSRWVAEATLPQTRARRAVAAAERIKGSTRRPLSA